MVGRKGPLRKCVRDQTTMSEGGKVVETMHQHSNDTVRMRKGR